MASHTPTTLSTEVPHGKEEAILKDVQDPTYGLLSRLESWIHVVDMIDAYVDSHIAIQKSITQGLEKARKNVADAPRFDYASSGSSDPSSPVADTGEASSSVTGVAESFEVLRSTTDALINKSNDTEQGLRTGVLPQLATLKGDIEKHIKGLKSTGVKNSKDVQKAKEVTQASIEKLGSYVSSFNINTHTKLDYKNDPYVLHRHVVQALEDQVAKENYQTDALISVEKNFETLEKHITQVIQQAVSLLHSTLTNYSRVGTEGYDNIAQTFAAIPAGYEWSKFASNPNSYVVPYDKPKRRIENIYFANSDAPSTKPVIEGIMQRKDGKLLKSYTSAYYVLTPSRFLLQYSSQDSVRDATPEFAIYIPDAQVGELNPHNTGKHKFIITAKDGARTIGIGHKTYTFKLNTHDELVSWHNAITGKSLEGSPITSPTASPQAVRSPVFEQAPASAAAPVAAEPVAESAAEPIAATAAEPVVVDHAAAPAVHDAVASPVATPGAAPVETFPTEPVHEPVFETVHEPVHAPADPALAAAQAASHPATTTYVESSVHDPAVAEAAEKVAHTHI